MLEVQFSGKVLYTYTIGKMIIAIIELFLPTYASDGFNYVYFLNLFYDALLKYGKCLWIYLEDVNE